MDYPQIVERLFNTPLMIDPVKAATILSVIGPRLGVGPLEIRDPLGVLAGRLSMEGATAERSDGATRPFGFAGGIAHIPVFGTLVSRTGSLEPTSGMTGINALSFKHRAAMGDPEVKAVLFEIDSHGGEPAINDFAANVFAGRRDQGGKLTVAFVAGQALSAGFALASAADVVVMTQYSSVGSIGVVAMHADFSEQLAQEGIRVTFFQAGARKVSGNQFEPPDEEFQREIQAEVARIYELFVGTVAQQRPGLTDAAIRAQEARVFRGPAGLDQGLADGMGSLEDVVAGMAQEIANESSPVAAQLAARAAS